MRLACMGSMIRGMLLAVAILAPSLADGQEKAASPGPNDAALRHLLEQGW
jgi:hypothetical protein